MVFIKNGKIEGPELRRLLNMEGPQFYQLMNRIINLKLITKEYDQKIINNQELIINIYSITPLGKRLFKRTQKFYR